FGQQIDDKTISSQVKAKVTTDKFVHLFSTGVGTHFGIVRLSGNVGTADERVEAERIASRVQGVKGVVNDILVVPRDGRMTGTAGSPSPAASPGSTGSTGSTGTTR
ncbi:MAG TPA: BON domain-containing protein, partial [Candidatus Acidoferrum sp.]|nr:BON domain-containing protein [Candidatus Acidoferrum sp.]